jgi:gas vesicle protein
MKTCSRYPAAWLITGAVVGSASALLFLWRPDAGRQLLDERAAQYQELPEEQRHLVRLSYQDLKSQSAERQREVRAIHSVSRQDPQLARVIRRYSEWQQELPRTERNQYQQLDVAGRIDFVRRHWSTTVPNSAATMEIRFSDASARRLPPLRISASEFWQLASVIVPESQRPDSLRQELAEFHTDSLRALCLTLWIFERVNAARENPAQLKGVDEGIRTARNWLLNEPRDTAWRNAFRESWQGVKNRPWEVSWLVRIVYPVLSEAAEELGQELLRNYPLSDSQLLDEFSSLTQNQQRELMTLPPALGRARLQLLTRADTAGTPEQRLVVKFAEFARNRDQLLRTIFFSIGLAPRSTGNSRTQP